MKCERVLPFEVNIEDVLIELLEYMEDRQDVNDSETGPAPNKEMNFATDIRQMLFQIEKAKKIFTVVNPEVQKSANCIVIPGDAF